MLRLIAAVEAAKMPGGKQRDQQHASTAGEDVACVPHPKITDAQHQDITGDDVKKSPKHVDGRRREPFPWRLCEWALERPAHHAADEMWNGIRKEGTAEKIR